MNITKLASSFNIAMQKLHGYKFNEKPSDQKYLSPSSRKLLANAKESGMSVNEYVRARRENARINSMRGTSTPTPTAKDKSGINIYNSVNRSYKHGVSKEKAQKDSYKMEENLKR